MARQQIDVTANPGGDTGIEGGTKINANALLNDALQTLAGLPDGSTEIGAQTTYLDSSPLTTDTFKVRFDKLEQRDASRHSGEDDGASRILGQDFDLDASTDGLLGTTYVNTAGGVVDQYPNGQGLYEIETTRSALVTGTSYAEGFAIQRKVTQRDGGATRAWISTRSEGANTPWREITADTSPEIAAPDTTVKELERSNDDGLRFGTGPIIRAPRPRLQGSQHRVLFAGGRYNNTPGFKVPSKNTKANARQASEIAATCGLPYGALLDATTIQGRASGTYLADSPDPYLCADLAIESGGTVTALRQPGGNIRADVPSVQVGTGGMVEVSHMTCGENALGKAAGVPLEWELEWTLHGLGYDGTHQYAGQAGSASTVRVTGVLRWGDLRSGNKQGLGGLGPLVQQISDQWTGYKRVDIEETAGVDPCVYKKDYDFHHHGKVYRALWDVPAVEDTTTDLQSESELVALLVANKSAIEDNRLQYEPGATRYWRTHWTPPVEEIRFDFLANVDLQQRDIFLHLRLGGPYQMDLNTSVPNHTTDVAGAGANDTYVRYNTPEASVVEEGGAWYAPRFDHFKADSPTPGGTAGAEWERYWRLMGPLRQDVMQMHSCIITQTGGRVGVADIQGVL